MSDWKIVNDKKFLENVLAKSQSAELYGRITVVFEKGEIIRVIEEKSTLAPKENKNMFDK